jgi:hypothetical protein
LELNANTDTGVGWQDKQFVIVRIAAIDFWRSELTLPALPRISQRRLLPSSLWQANLCGAPAEPISCFQFMPASYHVMLILPTVSELTIVPAKYEQVSNKQKTPPNHGLMR